MNKVSSPLQIVCRPAQPGDHADVTEFCKGIWDGEDFVPDAWEDWRNDPNGLLAVAEANGHAIGCSKITRITDDQWWLQGFRVDPNYQGLKVGSRLHSYVTDWWLAHGQGVLRLMTDAGNFAVHRVCMKTGYVKTHELCAYKAAPLSEPAGNFSLVTDLHEAAELAMASESIRSTDGLSDFGWQVAMADERTLEAYASEQAEYHHTLYWWQDRRGLCSAWENEDDGKRIFALGVVACTLKDMPALLTDIRRLAAQEKFDIVFQIAFDMPQVISALEAAGFEKKWKRSNAFVFEKKHPGPLAVEGS